MADKNTMEPEEFLKYHLFWMVIWTIWYHFLLFRALQGMGTWISRLVLVLLMLGCSFQGILYQWEHDRNNRSICANLVIGCGGYTALAYLPLRPELIRGGLALTAVAAGWRGVRVRLRPIRARTPARYRRLWRLRRQHITEALHSTVALGMAGMLLLFLGFSLQGGGVLNPGVRPTNASRSGEQTPAVHQDRLLCLQQDRWEDLTPLQRLDVLQTVANIEQSALGLPHSLRVVADDLEPQLNGYYEDEVHRIVVSLDNLLDQPASKSLTTVCHEAYHSYEYNLVERYAAASEQERTQPEYAPAQTYAREFDHYISGEEDMDGYYRQRCEQDARAYAEDRAADYQAWIWLTEN